MMKKLVLITVLLASTAIMFGQFSVNYSGGITNHPSTPIMVYLEVDSAIVDSVLTTPSTAGYVGTYTATTRPWIMRVLFDDCSGNEIYNTQFPAPAATFPYTLNFPTLNYCAPSGCNAIFTKFQAIDPVTSLPIPNRVELADASTGTALTYSWDFGDGSAPVAGQYVTHTYSTHGSYNICLTVVGSTMVGTCTSIFCDTLTVDSLGFVRGSFIVTTGGSSTSLEDEKSIENLKLFPNPATEFIVLDFEIITSSDLIVKIFDTKGSEIKSINKSIFAGNNKIELNTSDMEEGLYIIKLLQGNSFVTKRFQVIK